MLESAAKLLDCSQGKSAGTIPKCNGVGCMAWVVQTPDKEVWQVFHNDSSVSDAQRLSAKSGGVSLTRPGDSVSNVWVFDYSHSNGDGSYDQWSYQPTSAAMGDCAHILGNRG